MSELAYAENHPAHPANKGKKFSEPRTAWNSDYPADHPCRGGQGQAIPLAAAEEGPRDGFKHLHGLDGHTLAERQKEFARLAPNEREARLKWNEDGIPASPAEE